MTPWIHAQSSAKKWGGRPEDYMFIHEWMDETKELTGNWTHRALRHSSHGVQLAVEKFGSVVRGGTGDGWGVLAPLKAVVEQHIIEDCGYIPTVQDWLKPLLQHPEPWMLKVGTIQTQPLEITP